jgi:DNA-binding HxlR family transcriptional regulator
MSCRSYGQFCGLARALELVGERWSLLVIRDLILGPKRFTDLRRGLPRIPTNILATRLKELEEAAIVQRRILPRPATSVVYELTPYGQELKQILLALGVWGARSLGPAQPDDSVTVDTLMLGLEATFQPEAARGFTAGYEVRLGSVVVHARITDGALGVGEGPLAGADLVIETGPALKALMSGEMSPDEALENGSVRLTGNRELLTRFVEIFHLSSGPLDRDHSTTRRSDGSSGRADASDERAGS